MSRLLLVDDDSRLTGMLGDYLRNNGFEVETAASLAAARSRLQQGGFDALVLDLMLPDGDGLDFTRELRSAPATRRLPLLMLTARGEPTDRIVGLEIGADDYLGKPFNPRELLARVHAILRRVEHEAAKPGEVLRAGPVVVDPEQRTATMDGAPLDLTSTEFDILRSLVENAGRVIPREKLMGMARGEAWASFDRSVDVHISHLRRKLGDDPKTPALIKTVRGIGYIMPRERGPER